ncbi:protein kinase C-binding protein NELL2a isoform X4 [Gouania willdenowi]|uniref:Protein kinase C-binding protein NELL2 n=1 Tax=Gouania willdenowi TaxID=441366 RepID=A0A8C5G417_GOUWI|nr:protein kinase C-binding protein NELL2 isoform X4 [Gouania willdenowi]
MGLLRCLLAFCVLCPASGFGVDPTLRISILDELMLPQSFDGVTQVQGFHGQSRAFLFQGSSRDVKAAAEVAKRMVQKLRGKNEFTVLVTLKQDYLNSGVIFSIHHSEHRFLELESSGQRNEVRLHYRTKGQQDHTEVFPYSLADNQWHKVSVAVSASHVILHVDCNRIYERVVEAPYMDIPGDTLFWLGQRNSAHGLFKGVMQDVEILVMPQGYISQCPDLNRTCPTCNDFHGLVQKIMELQDVLAKTSRKLSRAEEKMNALDGCYCERTCNISGVVYREDEGWTDGCMNCTCTNGSVHCETISCPPAQCPAGTTPTYVKGVCCKECQPVCLFGGREVVDGDMKAVRDSTGRCLLFECRDRTMHQIVSSEPCPELNCPEAEQITLSDRCCKICQGHDFCSEGHGCVEHSDCVNLEAGDCCVCKDGFRPLREDNAYCEEHDVCLSGLHNCDENALCLNIVGGHSCSCKPGYMGNGTVCKALCDGLCQNGGTCASPNNCICQQGFTGKRCETDINECAEGFIECDSKSTCVNLPGWYHCECRDGYHDNGFFSANGESCVDINECKTGRNTCTNDTVCFNLEGSYDCRCPHGHNCTGDCIHDNKVKHSGQIWILDSDRCSVCSCQAGQVMCRRMVCDCNNPNADLYCCPECDPRLSSQCLHQNGLLTYSSGDTWVENCQQCQCLQGQVDCWPLSCPPGDCEFTVVPEGECCPRCVTDPCQADTIRNDITKTCSDEHNISRFSGSSWIKHGTECTLCQCKNGHICCSVDPMCL